MKVLVSLGLAAACLMASPAFAGPAGTGLTFTEEVARKALEKKRSADVRTPSDCAKAGLSGKPDDAAKPDGAKPDGAARDTCRAS
jgi:hypothetical protein